MLRIRAAGTNLGNTWYAEHETTTLWATIAVGLKFRRIEGIPMTAVGRNTATPFGAVVSSTIDEDSYRVIEPTRAATRPQVQDGYS